MTQAWLCTREDVMSALDVKATARDTEQIDRIIAGESRGIERALNRYFAPTLDTRYFDWPRRRMDSASWDLWLDDNELIRIDSITSGGTLIPATIGGVTAYYGEPANNPSKGLPYNRISLSLAAGAAFTGGPTFQRSIAVTGLFGCSDDSIFAGTSVGQIDADFNVLTFVADNVGVGTVIQIEDERILATDRNMADTSRVLVGDITASAAVTTVVTDGATIYPGEVILLDAEQMLVTDVVGNSLIVKRQWSGTVLAAHSNGAHIYSNRAFTVERGALGTTAVAHANGTTWTAWVVPRLVNQLCVAESLNTFQQEQSGYARTVGAGDSVRNATGAGLESLRARVKQAYGRQARQRAI